MLRSHFLGPAAGGTAVGNSVGVFTMVKSDGGRAALNLGAAAALAVFLGGCGSFGSIGLSPQPAPPPPVEPESRPRSVPRNWSDGGVLRPIKIRTTGLERGRGQVAVQQSLCDQRRRQWRRNHASCRRGRRRQELRLKGSQSGKNYIGPESPPGGPKDREIVSFDGHVLITRFIDSDAATRYGNMVYIRCTPAAASAPRHTGRQSHRPISWATRDRFKPNALRDGRAFE